MTKNSNDADGSSREERVGRNEAPTSDRLEPGEAAQPVDTDRWVQVHQAYYDREGDEELATTITLAVAEAGGVDPLDREELPPLYESIDASALEDTFFAPSWAETDRQEGSVVSFHYDEYTVLVRADGWILVYALR